MNIQNFFKKKLEFPGQSTISVEVVKTWRVNFISLKQSFADGTHSTVHDESEFFFSVYDAQSFIDSLRNCHKVSRCEWLSKFIKLIEPQ